MTKVKICGITNLEDAQAAVEEGADAIGFIFYPKSPRYISFRKAREIVSALPPFVSAVGVFVNEEKETIRQAARETALSLVQLHGEESPEFCKNLGLRVIKAIRLSRMEDLNRVKTYSVQGILFDSYHEDQYGGSGKSFNLDWLRNFPAETPVIISGGLTPDNVGEVIDRISPYAVDVSSGVENSPGKKSREKLKHFIQNAKGIR
jgi:phosphoribosylanthranilate isomerase